MNNSRAVLNVIKCTSNIIERFIMCDSSKYKLDDLTGQQMHILGYININHMKGIDIFQKDIETKLNVRPSTATVMLNAMEKKGYIKRESIPHDARLKKLVITEKAKEMSNRAYLMMEEINKQALNGINDDELEVFYKVIDKISSNLNCDTKNNRQEESE